MIDERDVLERALRHFELEPGFTERVHRRRDRKPRNERIAAGVVGLAVFVAAVWIVTSVGSLDGGEKSVVPAGTGPVQTPLAETALPPALAPDVVKQETRVAASAGGHGG
jgi:hypothetical protein